MTTIIQDNLAAKLPRLQPMDVVVLYSSPGYPWYKWFAHKLITWRSLEDAVHCVTIETPAGDCWSPEFSGILHRKLSEYNGYRATIHRYKKPFDTAKLISWCQNKQLRSSGYDFFKQWLMGYVLGMLTSISNDENRWTCSEWPYWAFQDNGYKVTEKDELLPMPRLFRYNTHFNCIFEGVIKCP